MAATTMTPLPFLPQKPDSDLLALPVLSRPLIARHVAQGQLLIIHRQLVYRVPHCWIDGQHPGGDLSILHFVGRDATEEIEAYHGVETIRHRMGKWIVGRVAEGKVLDGKGEQVVETEGEGRKMMEMVEFREKGGDFKQDKPVPVPKNVSAVPPSWDFKTGSGWSNTHGWLPLVPPVQIHKWPVPSSGISISDIELPAADYDPSAPGNELTPLHHRLNVLAFRRLRTDLLKKGLFQREDRLKGYGPDLVRYVLLFAGFVTCWMLARSKSQRDFQRAFGETTSSPLHGSGPAWPVENSYYDYGNLTDTTDPIFEHWFTQSAKSHSLVSSTKPSFSLSAAAWTLYALAGAFLGTFWHQVTFIGHDAGHLSVWDDWWSNRLNGSIVAGFVAGLGLNWWSDNHNIHHIVTNEVEHDPDIQHVPIFAISTRFFESLRSTYYKRVMWFDWAAKRLIRYQHLLYYLILAFGRFNLHAMSYGYLMRWNPKSKPLKTLRRVESLACILHWTWFGVIIYNLIPQMTLGEETASVGVNKSMIVRALFVIVAFVCTSPLHVQVVLSHYSQSTISPGLLESFPARQLRTTMDIDCPPYLDFLHGGLHMQVSHHLFPRLPRHNLRQVRLLVMKWIREEEAGRMNEWEEKGWEKKVGDVVEYKEMEWIEGNKSVISVLRGVAKQVELLGEVSAKQARGECPLMG